MLSLLPTWRSLVNIYFEQRTFDVSIYIPDVALDCIASSESVNLSCDKKRCFYNYKLAIAFKDKELPGGLWCDLLGFSDRPSFKACYMSPVCKRDGDIQWRMLHGALATNKRLVQISFYNTVLCLFCNGFED